MLITTVLINSIIGYLTYNSRGWKIIVSDKNVTLFLLLGILVFASFQMLSSGIEDFPTEAETIYDVFKLAVKLEKSVFEIGETVHMNITLVNIGEENATITFGGGITGQTWFWRVYDENDRMVFYYKYLISPSVWTEVTLQPDQFIRHERTWDQIDTNTEQQVPPGIYCIIAAVGFTYKEESVPLETRIKIAIK